MGFVTTWCTERQGGTEGLFIGERPHPWREGKRWRREGDETPGGEQKPGGLRAS